ncbi:MAG: hypothetical protein NPIRA06_04850 [Nitrospirales bacterium]|nr:MAG: hypothetical protein NPIRA06_04850 [Nitrospirales bacterium]
MPNRKEWQGVGKFCLGGGKLAFFRPEILRLSTEFDIWELMKE